MDGELGRALGDADGAGGTKRPREERGSTSTVLHFALLCFTLLYVCVLESARTAHGRQHNQFTNA